MKSSTLGLIIVGGAVLFFCWRFALTPTGVTSRPPAAHTALLPTPSPSLDPDRVAERLVRAIKKTVRPLVQSVPAPSDSSTTSVTACSVVSIPGPSWIESARRALADEPLHRLREEFAQVKDRVYVSGAQVEAKRQLYLALQDLWQLECDLSAAGREPPVLFSLLSSSYGPAKPAATAGGMLLLVFCGHEPRHRIEPRWIHANRTRCGGSGQLPLPGTQPGDADGSAREWYAEYLAAHLAAPRTRLVDSLATDDALSWAGQPRGMMMTEPQLLSSAAIRSIELSAAVSGLAGADRLEFWLSSDFSAGAAPSLVAILRPIRTTAGGSGPGGGSTELCHALDPRLLPRDPIRIGLRLVRSPFGQAGAVRVGLVGLRFSN